MSLCSSRILRPLPLDYRVMTSLGLELRIVLGQRHPLLWPLLLLGHGTQAVDERTAWQVTGS